MADGIQYGGALTCAIDVANLKASMAWYQDVLGFKVRYVLDDMGWGEMETGVANVTVGLGASDKPATGSATALVFEVKDIEAAVAHLRAKGATVDGEIETIPDMVKLVKFRDPDGNLLMFSQTLALPG
jgi:predicted enzyme related to lactoylglutathione lyase